MQQVINILFAVPDFGGDLIVRVAPEWTRGDNPVGWTEAYDYQRHGIDILLNGYAEVDL